MLMPWLALLPHNKFVGSSLCLGPVSAGSFSGFFSFLLQSSRSSAVASLSGCLQSPRRAWTCILPPRAATLTRLTSCRPRPPTSAPTCQRKWCRRHSDAGSEARRSPSPVSNKHFSGIKPKDAKTNNKQGCNRFAHQKQSQPTKSFLFTLFIYKIIKSYSLKRRVMCVGTRKY